LGKARIEKVVGVVMAIEKFEKRFIHSEGVPWKSSEKRKKSQGRGEGGSSLRTAIREVVILETFSLFSEKG